MYLLCFLLVMLSPVAFFVVGLLWRLSPPAFLSKGLAYRTALTEKSPEAWRMAHVHCAKLWMRIGLILSVLSAVLMTVFQDAYTNFFLWLIGGQMAIFCASALLVDTLLKNTFDENGTPRI